MITLEAVEAAAAALRGEVLRTPCLPSPRLSALTGANVYVKYENLQATGSFKERGAFVRMQALSPAERAAGVVAMSAGNHAQGVAYHARRLGIEATIVMPVATPFVKVAATEAHGATVVLAGETVAESAVVAAELVAAGRVLVHPYDDPLVAAGQGTLGLEMIEDVPALDTLVVPIGGGGLIAGVATAVRGRRPDVRVVGVEAVLFPSAHAAIAGVPARCGGATLAEGIAVKTVGRVTLPVIRALVERIVLVDEPALERAVNAYITLQKTMAEGAGAAGLAAMLTEPELFRGRTVGLVLCGGNIDPRLLASIMVRELARERRIVSLEADYPDEPGLLAKLTTAIAGAGGNILEVGHNRLALTHLARETSVRVTIETRDDRHTDRVVAAIRATGLVIRPGDNVDGGF